MSIGICDADFLHYPNAFFNLDVMKLWPYYSKRGKIISLMDDFLFDKYSQIIYCQDYPGSMPPNLSKYDVYFRGRALSSDKYIPMADEIEKTIPNTLIYDRLFSMAFPSKDTERQLKVIVNAAHARLSLDGSHVWDYLPQYLEGQGRTATIFFHDYYPNQIMDKFSVLEEICKSRFKNPKGISYLGFKFPIEVDQFDDLIGWIEFPYKYSSGTTIMYRGSLSGDQCEQLAACLRDNPRRLHYVITGNSSSQDDFDKNHLREILKQAKYFREHNLKILLTSEDDFFIDRRGENLCLVLNFFINDERPTATFLQACRDVRDGLLGRQAQKTTSKLREAFYYVNENTDCTEDLYDSRPVTLKGGKLEYD